MSYTASPIPEVAPELLRQQSQRSIPSLDGLRALSVLAVVLSHFNAFSSLPKKGLLHGIMTLLGLGGIGVSTFFVISGYLITTLLLQEQERTGTVRLGRFYFRRTLRILPPFYVYLVVVTLVAWARHQPLHGGLVVASAAYVLNYVPYLYAGSTPSFWYLAHTWSLAVEEQFYLLWPLLLLLCPPRRVVQLCIGTLLLVPFLRLLTLVYLPMYSVAEQWSRVFHGSADLLALGGLLGVLARRPHFGTRVSRLFHPALLLAAAAFLPLSAVLRSHTPAWVDAVFLVSFTGLSIALLLLWVVLRPHTAVGRVLNSAPLRHIGRISYSLYLWQQLCVGPTWGHNGIGNLVLLFVVAELAYWLVEQPSLRLRTFLERNWFRAAAAEHPCR